MKQDKITYGALHLWIARHKPKSNVCENCKQKKQLELANISQQYKRDINDFRWLCRSCHIKMDYGVPKKPPIDYVRRLENNKKYHSINKEDVSKRKEDYYLRNKDKILQYHQEHKEIRNKRRLIAYYKSRGVDYEERIK